jgi:hypothetical protein
MRKTREYFRYSMKGRPSKCPQAVAACRAYKQARPLRCGACGPTVAVWDRLPGLGEGETAEMVAWARDLGKSVYRVWAGRAMSVSRGAVHWDPSGVTILPATHTHR